MMWAMTWVTGTMASTMPATTPAKGMAGTPVGRGGGLLAEDRAAAAAAAAMGAMAATAAVAAYCRGCLLFIVKIFCVVFLWVGGIGEVTPPLTLLLRLRYVGLLLGVDGNCPQKLWYESRGNIQFQYFTLKYFNSKQKSILLSLNLFFVFHGEAWLMWNLRGQGHSDKGTMQS
jgi:hypothetical protein